MQIVILTVGKLKERYWREAEAEYRKRLLAHASCLVETVQDEPDQVGVDRCRETEAGRLLAKLRERDHVIALDSRGKKMTSLGFSEYLRNVSAEGYGRYVFVIGGSRGLASSVLDRADHTLSFSDFTFPHQLMRIILLEQIYRAFRIQTGAPYHK